MTAIACAFGVDGFAVAADGRRTDAATAEVVSDSVQKIHIFENKHIHVAYALKGSTVLFKNDESLDLSRCVSDIVRRDKFQVARTPYELATYVGKLLLCDMVGFHGSLYLPDSIRDTSLMLVGYLDKQPFYATLNFLEKDGNKAEPSLGELGIPSELKVFSGSRTVLDALMEQESWNHPPATVGEAHVIVTSYVLTCIDNEPTLEDCVGMGGHMHSLIIKPDGVSWSTNPLFIDPEVNIGNASRQRGSSWAES